MAAKSNLVNLDAMLKRDDFAVDDAEESSFEKFQNITVRDLLSGGLIGPSLRKPDFQRETNHWTPEQVVSLLECFVSGDLIPSVILWKSSFYLFVIDGGHRISVLRSWLEDDYGDGPLSNKLFGNDIPAEQIKAAERTRRLVKERVGTWKHFQARLEDTETLENEERKKVTTATTRGIAVQWVTGDAEKAESSFFNINMKGTPLDSVEELLLKNRKKPIAIAARAIIRAGKGHKYWSNFDDARAAEVERIALNINKLLFSPEIKRPIRTLDLPLGGSKGVRTALQILISFVELANKGNASSGFSVSDYEDDLDGEGTIKVLRRAEKLASRITGNGNGSLGLHPAIYFYGPTGRHSTAMFMGTVSLIAQKLANNDQKFFSDFTAVRRELEKILIEHKDLIAGIVQKSISPRRVAKYHQVLESLISELKTGNEVNQDSLVSISQLEGKIVTGDFMKTSVKFTEEDKSKVFIIRSLESSQKCSICGGYLDMDKSVSYDHIVPVRDGGVGSIENCDLVHPYCNQSIKC